MILYLLRLALFGSLGGALTAGVLWFVLHLLKTGPSRTKEVIQNLGHIAEGTRLSASWLTKTGALPAGILGLVAAPYLGPILGGYLWRPLAGLWGPLASFSADLGALLVGILAGILGYLLRIP